MPHTTTPRAPRARSAPPLATLALLAAACAGPPPLRPIDDARVTTGWEPASPAIRAFCDARQRVTTGVVRHVATTGADVAGCGTEAAPCATLQFAYDALAQSGGATVYLHGGTYTGTALVPGATPGVRRANGASASEPIHVTSFPGEWAVFDGSGATVREPVFRVDGNFLRFSCFEVRDFANTGFFVVDPSHDVELDHLQVHDVVRGRGGENPSGIKAVTGTTRLHVHHNEVWNVRANHAGTAGGDPALPPGQGVGALHNFAGIMLFDASGRGDSEVDHNFVHGCGAGIRAKHASAVDHPPIVIHHNVVRGCDAPECAWGLSGGDRNLHVHHNVVFRLPQGIGFVCASDGAQPCGATFNNTLVARDGFAAPSIDDPRTAQDTRFVNNVVVNTGLAFLAHANVGSLLRVDHNAYAAGTFQWRTRYRDLAAWQAASMQDARSRTTTWAPAIPDGASDIATVIAALRAAQRPASEAEFLCAGGAGGEFPAYLGAVACERRP